jgi:putative PIN family toxin of toxin-antitoxin system
VPGPRAVLDTSVLVSAILRPDGPSGAILRAARRGRFVMVTSPAILDELVDVLPRPKLRAQARVTFEDVAKIRLALQQFAETVPGAYRPAPVLEVGRLEPELLPFEPPLEIYRQPPGLRLRRCRRRLRHPPPRPIPHPQVPGLALEEDRRHG